MPAPETASRWTDELFARHRNLADPPADEVIAHVLDVHSIHEINHMMRLMVHNDDLPLTEMPPLVVDYLNDTFMLPLWTNPGYLRRANAIFDSHGPEIVLLLFAASLPVLYAKQHGAPVLTITRRLSDLTTFQRRIVETGQFLLDVTDRGAFTEDGRGIRTTQKVRLMHAAVRHYILNDVRWQSQWDATWGLPINQSDLAGTMLSFSVTVIDGLDKAGIVLTPEDREAYLHLWKLVGHVMGVMSELMPRDYPDAQIMMQRWQQQHYGASEAGHLLTKTLIDFLHERVPGRRFDSYTTNWMRVWLGDTLADALNVPPQDSGMRLVEFHRLLLRIQQRYKAVSPIARWLSRWFIRRLLNALIDIERAGKEVDFRIPERLQAQWALRRPERQ